MLDIKGFSVSTEFNPVSIAFKKDSSLYILVQSISKYRAFTIEYNHITSFGCSPYIRFCTFVLFKLAKTGSFICSGVDIDVGINLVANFSRLLKNSSSSVSAFFLLSDAILFSMQSWIKLHIHFASGVFCGSILALVVVRKFTSGRTFVYAFIPFSKTFLRSSSV